MLPLSRIHLALALLVATPLCNASEQGAGSKVNFAREVLPILSDKCFVCHGPDGEAKDVLRLDSFEAATQEVVSGKFVMSDANQM